MAGRGGRGAPARRARRRRAGPAAATSTEQNPTHSLSAVVSPAAFWNSPRGQPAAATAYGATAETAVEGTAGGATASLAAATGAQEAFDAAARRAHARMHISERGGARVLPKCSVGRGLAVSRSCHLIMPPPGRHLPGAPITLAPPHIVGAGTTICSWPIIKRTRADPRSPRWLHVHSWPRVSPTRPPKPAVRHPRRPEPHAASSDPRAPYVLRDIFNGTLRVHGLQLCAKPSGSEK